MQHTRPLHVFPVPSIGSLLAHEKVRLSKPEQVSGYSLHADGRVAYDQSLLKELRPAKIGSNLLEGIEGYAETNEPTPLQPILDAVQPANRAAHNAAARLTCPPLPAIDIVTFRNNLNKLLAVRPQHYLLLTRLQTPYNTNNPYAFHVQRRGRTLFLNIHQEPPRDGPVHPAQRDGAYAGRRYERLSAASTASGEYCGVFSMALGPMQLLVGAELDGVDTRGHYVELKTYRLLESAKDRYSFERYKCLAFWIQSYLAGVPFIRCGFRNAAYELRKEQTFETAQLPAFGAKYWQPSACLAFAKLVLEWLTTHVPDDTDDVFVVEFDPRARQLALARANLPSFVPTELPPLDG
ncbi:hypothetical protein ACHHYP_11878 [Achlya hypogyna]|uniref:Decapping nuclease n=1 Tax=Achlya hypogyna TaxID=1202772 RepID=A0A1V9YI75_ACHHY|nr:hypothetical protein ACHHYP_11878 [Achlya hypogyna]